MQLALWQGNGALGDVEANLTLLAALAEQAVAVGAQLLVLPELFVSGYNLGRALCDLAEPCSGPTLARVATIARRCGLAIAAGYPERDGERIYDAVALFDRRGTLVAHYRKTHLFGAGEQQLFTPGAGWSVVDLEGWRIGLLVCYDVEFPEAVRSLALAGAELVLVPAANFAPQVNLLLVPARAFENQIFVACANRCGLEGDLLYCGRSVIAGPDGSALATTGSDPALLVAQLDREWLVQERRRYTYLRERRPELYTQ